MRQFKIVDNIFGWLAFVIAAYVYCSTIEPTASFWDCPEFITTGYKLEVGHPPGAPFFMLTANLFSQLTSDPTQVAKMVNMMNALLSAACIMFLFWSISHLTRRLLIEKWEELTIGKTIAIEASAMVGALIYCFSDTFWYSAVEGEVYAYSSAFTALVFWLILKWEDHADEPHSDRYLVLIAYMTGVSVGVHLLNLLCIPAIVLVWYYKRNKDANLKGSILYLLLSFIIVVAVLYGVVPGIITVGGWFELFFVNALGMPFNTGLIIYIFLLIATVIWAIYESYTQKSASRENISFLCVVGMLGIPFYGFGWQALLIGIVVLVILAFALTIKKNGVRVISSRIKNTTLCCMLMLMIGYSSYAVIVIRSSANTPMDQNSPEDIFTLGNYLSRDQYGYRPLLYGQTYNSEWAFGEQTADGYVRPKMTKGAPIYERKEKASADEKDSYFVASTKDNLIYEQNVFFPRMYSEAHRAAYESWLGGIQGRQVPSVHNPEQSLTIPTAAENLRFFLSYQCNFMYWRYFMWNFAGRQNDIQGNGELEHGNWITGFKAFDNMLYGDQDLLPDELKENKGHNVFYCLPLLLGLIGLLWQAYRGKKGIQQFWVVFFLFFMTGLAIVLYLNQTPQQPRERDYAYAGSFYAYAIWCGLGVAGIISMITKLLKGKAYTIVASVVGALSLLVPIQMVSQTWDDHDRSNRFTCRDFGQNYLMSLQDKGNPVIFTNGDNDTFPLWYNQETENFRTDARVCNLSYLQTDWYIDQMKRPAYDSPSLPINWPRLKYVTGTNTSITVQPDVKENIRQLYKQNPQEARRIMGDNPFELKNIIKMWILNDVNDEQRNFMKIACGGDISDPDNIIHVIPTDTMYITLDKDAVRQSGVMLTDSIPDKMEISLAGTRMIAINDMMMLEMLANSNWKRPLYVAMTVGGDNYIRSLNDYFIQEGLAYRITPFNTKKSGNTIDTEKTYNAVMNRFKYGGVSTKGIYLDETVLRMCATHRRLLSQLALELVNEGKNDKALKVLQKAEKEIPYYNVPASYESGSLDMGRAYATIGKKKEAEKIYDMLWKKSEQYMRFYLSLTGQRFLMNNSECLKHLQIMNFITEYNKVINPDKAKKMFDQWNGLVDTFESLGGTLPNIEE
ncbi:MAG: DUF2723 domain-containing protein [Prevotella sp.]|nr:DUF2723 domain-containing protein [Prevotella sp.]